MILIVGLGNPGKEYQNTRHNVGWLVLDTIADCRLQTADLNWKTDKRIQAGILKVTIAGKDALLVKPQTFMNNSGIAVKTICNLKSAISNLIVVHDDIDLAFGTIRVSHDSASAGHKGVQSIIDHLGTKNFWRVRIGIRPSLKSIDTPDFVLNKFSKEEQKLLPNILQNVVTIIDEMITKKPTVKTVHSL